MGLISSILKRLSCNCSSDCHLDNELKELKRFAKNLAEDDLREIRDYILERENILNRRREEIRNEMRNSFKFKSHCI